MTDERYKCHACKTVVYESPCPVCGNKNIEPMCELDHLDCHHEMEESLVYCPKCGAACCPKCGCHDVAQLSRITGYIQDVGGWNAGKAQELKDRTRAQLHEVQGGR